MITPHSASLLLLLSAVGQPQKYRTHEHNTQMQGDRPEVCSSLMIGTLACMTYSILATMGGLALFNLRASPCMHSALMHFAHLQWETAQCWLGIIQFACK